MLLASKNILYLLYRTSEKAAQILCYEIFTKFIPTPAVSFVSFISDDTIMSDLDNSHISFWQ